MTFLPEVLTKIDSNNSTVSTTGTFTGISTLTTGYNTIILTVESLYTSAPAGIEIQFSDDNITFTTYFSDTFYSNSATNDTIFTKNYLILKKYYRISYTPANPIHTVKISSRLSTDLDSSLSSQNTSITVFDNSVENALDAFGRLRVANPTTLIDIRYPSLSIADGASSDFLKNNIQISTYSSNGTAGSVSPIFQNSKLIVTVQNDAYYMTQSRNYCTYQPGKSLLYLATGIINPSNSNFTSRFGYFDSVLGSPTTNPPTIKNGLYFEFSSGTIKVVKKNNTTTAISQSDWNIDKMDGSGPSGLNLDFTKTQLFVIDMEWLGIGRIRFGFYAYGRIQYCHQFTHINELIEPYTNSINLPISYQIIGNNVAGGSGTMTQICSTIISEGGYTPVGRPFHISNGTTFVSVPSTTEVAILAIRGGGSNYYHQNIIPTGLSTIAASTNDLIQYRLRLYLDGNIGTTSIATWTSVNSTYSVCQYAVGGDITTLDTTGSIIVDEGYFFGRGSNTFENLGNIFSSLITQVTANIENVSDILILTCSKIAGSGASSGQVYGSLNWQEVY